MSQHEGDALETKLVDSQQEEARKRQKIQQQLDEALEDSFPASDPVSIVTSNEEEDWGTEPNAPPGRGAEKDASR